MVEILVLSFGLFLEFLERLEPFDSFEVEEVPLTGRLLEFWSCDPDHDGASISSLC